MTQVLSLGVALLTALLTLQAPLHAQERFEAAEHGFSLTLPEGWRAFPASQIRHLNGQASSTESRASEFLAIVEDDKGGKITVRLYPTLGEEDAVAETRRVALAAPDTARKEPELPVRELEALDLIYGKPLWEEEDGLLWTAFTTGRMRALEVRRPYREGVIRVSWIGITEAELVAAQEIIAGMVASIRFREGLDIARRR